MRSMDWVRDGYGAIVARMVHFSVIGLVMVVVAGAGTVALSRVTPTGFVPEDDQGAMFVVVQLPGGASVGRTSEVMRQAEGMVKEDPAVAEYTSIIGLNFIDNYSAPNAGFMVVTFKPFEERKSTELGVREVIARLRTKFRQIQGAAVVPLAPPPIVGLGTAVASVTCLRTCAEAIRRNWPRFCAGWSWRPIRILNCVACSRRFLPPIRRFISISTVTKCRS